MSIVPDLPTSKIVRAIRQLVSTVTLGTQTKISLLKLPPQKFFLWQSFNMTHSQTLQTVPIGGILVDGEPLMSKASISSTNKQYLQSAVWEWTTSVFTTPQILIPVRQTIEMLVDSTAVGDGTVTTDGSGYILDDFDNKFKNFSTLTRP